ncbi:hypothetical protein Lpp14_06850 [Lacticaseibacillus paracasei subsp. paracasei Lpp14]|uniref:Uncharacterized protein n=1 Tax=Lacticaseibacillus paracasei subsp. paracasei Lpp14 TaxID=1256204 RepID=A0A829GQL4_LACPA|nr:hypothetical protein Lpp14_06850 [Lacticaseibacillus paracasei subsp. paracasei Lpp14]
MNIDIHLTNATPDDIKKVFQAISGSKEHKDEAVYLDATSSISSSSKNGRC